MAGGVPRFVRAARPRRHATRSWWLDESELAAAFTPRTRLVFVNTPAQPHRQGLHRATSSRSSAGSPRRVGALVVADEVYEHLVFAPARHVRAATLPELADAPSPCRAAARASPSPAGRWAGPWPRAARPCRAEGAPVGHLRHRRAAAGGGGRGPGPARRVLHRTSPPTTRAGATGSPRPSAAPASSPCRPRAPTSSWLAPTGCGAPARTTSPSAGA